MANTSPSGPGTNLVLTLSGKGTSAASMPCMPGTTKEETTVVPDTGFFSSSESGSASPFIIGGVSIFTFSLFALVFLLIIRGKTRLNFAKNFRIKNWKLVSKRLGIFTGLFLFAFLAVSVSLPNLIDEPDSASALNATNALAITTGSAKNNHTLGMSATLSETPTMAIAQESVSINTATKSGYTLYLSTDSEKEPALYQSENSCSGYILPASNTPAALEVNHWGFAVDTTTDAALKNANIWSAVPKYNSEIAIKKVSTATSAGDTTNVFYGAFVKNTIPAGDYKTTVLYTAIANL